MMKNIIIFGGGTSGWLTAAYLVNNINPEIKVTLIEDASKGTIGVGEGIDDLQVFNINAELMQRTG